MEAVSCHFLVGFGGKQVLEYISRQYTLARFQYLEEPILIQNLGSTLSHCNPQAHKSSAEKRLTSSSKVPCYALSFQCSGHTYQV